MRILGLSLALVLVVVAAGCSGGSGGEEEPVTPAPQQALGTTTAVNEGVATATAESGGPMSATGPLPELTLQRVFPGVTMSRSTGLHQAADGSWWVLEQAGRIFRFDGDGAAAPDLFVDLTDRVNASGNEEGLLGFAFAPDFAESGAFYVNYTATNPRRTVISRFIANAADGTASAGGSETVLLEIDQPYSNHNGGEIAFGPDGYLYIATGDGGSGNDPQGNGQDLTSLLGKILRIDVSGDPYSVPGDNPFVGRADASAEVWAYGLRNPWRFSFDSETGELWAADVGQSAREEVNLISRGGNYGWVIMEGTQCVRSGCDQSGLELPVIDYARSGGRCSVTGGFVYRGEAIPDLHGAYVYGDYCSGEVWALRYVDGEVTEQGLVARLSGQISSFAQGNDGELYVLNHSAGGIYQLVD